MDIIFYLPQLIQLLYQQNFWLISFICRYISLKRWTFDDSHSPKYQKFKIDKLLFSKLSAKRIGTSSSNTISGNMANPSNNVTTEPVQKTAVKHSLPANKSLHPSLCLRTRLPWNPASITHISCFCVSPSMSTSFFLYGKLPGLSKTS